MRLGLRGSGVLRFLWVAAAIGVYIMGSLGLTQKRTCVCLQKAFTLVFVPSLQFRIHSCQLQFCFWISLLKPAVELNT